MNTAENLERFIDEVTFLEERGGTDEGRELKAKEEMVEERERKRERVDGICAEDKKHTNARNSGDGWYVGSMYPRVVPHIENIASR